MLGLTIKQNKRLFAKMLVVFGLGIVVGVVAGVALSQQETVGQDINDDRQPESYAVTQTLNPTPTVVQTLTHTYESEFEFDYPETWKVRHYPSDDEVGTIYLEKGGSRISFVVNALDGSRCVFSDFDFHGTPVEYDLRDVEFEDLSSDFFEMRVYSKASVDRQAICFYIADSDMSDNKSPYYSLHYKVGAIGYIFENKADLEEIKDILRTLRPVE